MVVGKYLIDSDASETPDLAIRNDYFFSIRELVRVTKKHSFKKSQMEGRKSILLVGTLMVASK